MKNGIENTELEAARRKAQQECERCQGRKQGDCDPACRHWWLTASEAEIEAVERPECNLHPRKGREWFGPTNWNEDGNGR